jgi:GDP-L-fucose synthase
MNPESRIYVAGHKGLVGSAIVRSLKRHGFENLVFRTHAELDLTDQKSVSEFFEAEKPKYVFLAAAKVGGIVANNTYPAEFILSNLAIQTNVINECWRSGVKRLLFLGSSCIYPRDCPQPIKEEYLLTGPLEKTNRPYAIAKIAGVEMCEAYNRQYETKFLAVMPTNLYGPGDHYDLQNSHVLPALIRKFHLAKLAMKQDWAGIEQDEEIHGVIPDEIKSAMCMPGFSSHSSHLSPHVVLWGTGTPRREFLYSEDMADACVHLMNLPEEKYTSLLTPDAPLSFPLINIGCGEDLSIAELAHLVKEVIGYEGEIVQDASKPDGTPRKLLDVSRVNAMGWKSETSLARGIEMAYADYLSRKS